MKTILLTLMLLLAGAVDAQIITKQPKYFPFLPLENLPGYDVTGGSGRHVDKAYPLDSIDTDIIRVTNLNPSGPGSLTVALNTPGPRFIIFETSGVIYNDTASSDWNLFGSTLDNFTIAGSTAPEPGITLVGQMKLHGIHNAVIEGLRQAGGDTLVVIARNDWGDAFNIQGNAQGTSGDLLFVGNSLRWSMDENIEIANYTAGNRMRNVGFYFNIVTEGLAFNRHGDALHSMGTSWGVSATADMFGNKIGSAWNLITSSNARAINSKNDSAFICNNLVYNFQREGISMEGELGYAQDYAVYGNKSKKGPLFIGGALYTTAAISYGAADVESLFAASETNVFWNQNGGEWSVEYDNMNPTNFDAFTYKQRPWWTSGHDFYHMTPEMEELILNNAGAWPRDSIDRRAVASYRTKTYPYAALPDCIGTTPQLHSFTNNFSDAVADAEGSSAARDSIYIDRTTDDFVGSNFDDRFSNGVHAGLLLRILSGANQGHETLCGNAVIRGDGSVSLRVVTPFASAIASGDDYTFVIPCTNGAGGYGLLEDDIVTTTHTTPADNAVTRSTIYTDLEMWHQDIMKARVPIWK